MNTRRFTEKFIATQIAGSCRLDGVRVSAEEERLMCDIVTGKIDAQELRRKLVEQYRKQNLDKQSTR